MPKSIHSELDGKLREALRAARLQSGLTQTQLAERLHRPQSFVAKYEGGERRLDVIEFIQVCDAIGVDPAMIINQLER